ncbi:sugar phosphate isomerase/epimerase family protein [Tropicimonas isoalkanivorans]|uniref:D-psicose/D-tagatose/L-ribulose 3-epimerase n=1 Tax=Tropicimonas isoalkanivorans TaxID=441112 RepID=A0A1I1IVM6_9RHOB|nr:sugar phosphate isomerase/epimerase family protein [Tropicimonas isoalkanivorans]SFC40306.1 D-psicose/D-tagatose/L-ribulose 3-epimerase [Tropicimonas isoalkanivorans]
MAKLGLHTFAAAPKWDVPAMRALMPKFDAHKVRVLEIPLLDPAEIDVAETRAFMEETGIEPVCSLGLPDDINVIEDPDAGLAFLKPAFEVASGVGAAALAGVTYGTIGRISGAPRTQAEFDGTCRFIERAARMAADHGLKLGVEPCNRYETHIMNTGADGRAYCEAVGADNVFIHLDTYHMNIEEVSYAQGLRDCGPFLGYVHLSESNRGAPGAGTIGWDEVYRTLAEIGFEGTTTLESMNHVHPAIASALAIWRPVAATPADVIDAGLPFLHRHAEAAGFTYE